MEHFLQSISSCSCVVRLAMPKGIIGTRFARLQQVPDEPSAPELFTLSGRSLQGIEEANQNQIYKM